MAAKPVRFTVRLEPEGTGTYVVIPEAVVAALGARGRTSVAGTIDGHAFLNQVMPYRDDSPAGRRFYMVVNKGVRAEIGKAAGDEVEFELARDNVPLGPLSPLGREEKPMDLGLRDRIVLITGAGGGAGPTIAHAFAAEGARVALNHRGSTGSAARAEQAAKAIRDGGGQARAVAAELGDSDAIASMLGEIEAHLGQVAVLVNATSAYRSDHFAEIGDDAWAGVLNDMLGAAFRVSRAVTPGMAGAGWGRIVNIAARSGLVGVARAAHYAAAKAGIVGLTASLAKELGPQGILVNAIAPTQIVTVRDGQPSIPEDRQAELAKSIPARRVAVPSDLASLTVWLGSAANTFVSGEVISLTGGAQS